MNFCIKFRIKTWTKRRKKEETLSDIYTHKAIYIIQIFLAFEMLHSVHDIVFV